jgi:hypothetical protein
MLVVGVLLGVGVGGAGVSLASTTSTVTFCVNKKTAVVRQPKSGRCTKKETRRIMNSPGATGASGATGATGPQGVAGTTGATGATGATGPAGPVGESGVPGTAGAIGPMGPAGPVGPQGTPGNEMVFIGNTVGSYNSVDANEVILCSANGRHSLFLSPRSQEHVIVTASPIGVSTESMLTGFTQVAGPQSFDSPGLGSHRWQIVRVQQESAKVTQSDIVVIQNQEMCQVWFHSSHDM